MATSHHQPENSDGTSWNFGSPVPPAGSYRRISHKLHWRHPNWVWWLVSRERFGPQTRQILKKNESSSIKETTHNDSNLIPIMLAGLISPSYPKNLITMNISIMRTHTHTPESMCVLFPKCYPTSIVQKYSQKTLTIWAISMAILSHSVLPLNLCMDQTTPQLFRPLYDS